MAGIERASLKWTTPQESRVSHGVGTILLAARPICLRFEQNLAGDRQLRPILARAVLATVRFLPFTCQP